MGNIESIEEMKILLDEQIAKRNIAEQLLIQKDNELADLTKKLTLNSAIIGLEKSMAALVNNLNVGVFVEDASGKIEFVNKSFCLLFNIPFTVTELIGQPALDTFLRVTDMFNVPGQFSHGLQDEQLRQTKAINEVLRLKDGRVMERDHTPLIYEGQFLGHLWEFRDVTPKALVEKSLEEQREFYEEILNKIPADIAVFDADHRYLFLNPVAIKDPELRKWMIGKTDLEYCEYKNRPRSLAEERDRIFQEVISTKQLKSWEEKIINKEGIAEYHLRNMYPVIDNYNDVNIVIGYGINITERKLIEERVKKNEKRYRDLFNYSQALICTHDLYGRLLSVNPAICGLLGYKEDEMNGKLLTDFLPEADVPNFVPDYLNHVVEKGGYKGLFRILNKEGKQIVLLYENYKVEELDEEPYIIGFSQDITDRINAEKELRIAKQMTEQVSKAKEIFLANMSHEIRTPMNGILGVAGLLQKSPLNNEQKNYVKLITESANNLLVIVNDVLDVEKIASGKFELERIPFRLADKVLITMQSFEYKAEEKFIAMKFNSLLPNDLVVLGDPYRLGQILNNLVGNALKFTDQGKIEITAAIESEQDDEIIVKVIVADTGIGIGQDKLGVIFNPFVQASSDITRRYGGTGLGLSICKSLVEMQGGMLTVESELEHGTTFTFTINYGLGNMSMLATGEKEDNEVSDLKIKRVLVAEDVVLNQFLVKHMLEGWSIEVDIANNGIEAIEKLKINDYDAILMDIQMPEMDGITATGIIRDMEDRHKASVPIIALTANALKGDSDRYLKAGMNGYISKPYTENMMLAALKNATYDRSYNILKIENKEDLTNPEVSIKKVLVAEDVVLNQFLVKHMLEGWGMEVDIAGNGNEVLRLLNTKDYDLILMDIKMPGMDGFTATNIIRKMEDPVKAAIPIIALTSKDLGNDSSRYLNAGMNGCITKPYTEKMVKEALRLITKPVALPEVLVETPKNSELVAEPKNEVAGKIQDDMKGTELYDLSLLLSVANDDEEFIRQVLGTYMDTIPNDIELLEGAIRKKDASAISKLAHKIKPAIDYMGISILKNAIRKIEMMPEDFGETVKNVQYIKEVTNKVFDLFRRQFPGL